MAPDHPIARWQSWITLTPLFRLYTIGCIVAIGIGASSQLLQSPLALLQANLIFQSTQVQAWFPVFQGRLSFHGQAVGLHHRLAEAACRAGPVSSMKPSIRLGLAHVQCSVHHIESGVFTFFTSCQTQALHCVLFSNIVSCRWCPRVGKWHISYSKQKNKGISTFRTITRCRENLQYYCCISALPLV